MLCIFMCSYDAVIHFAGLKAVGESVAKPSLYYNNNLIGTLNLFEFMGKYGCKKVCSCSLLDSFSLRSNHILHTARHCIANIGNYHIELHSPSYTFQLLLTLNICGHFRISLIYQLVFSIMFNFIHKLLSRK